MAIVLAGGGGREQVKSGYVRSTLSIGKQSDLISSQSIYKSLNSHEYVECLKSCSSWKNVFVFCTSFSLR